MSNVAIVDTQEEKLAILRRMREEGLDRTVIYSLDRCSDEKWLDMLHNAWCLTMYTCTGPGGIVWFDNINGNTAQGHFCPFRENFPRAQAWGLEIIRWLETRLKVTMLTCISPRVYRHSRKLIVSWGFKEAFVMPQACYLAMHKKCDDGIFYVRKS